MLWTSIEDCGNDNAWRVVSKYLGVESGKDIFWNLVKTLKRKLMDIRECLRNKATQVCY